MKKLILNLLLIAFVGAFSISNSYAGIPIQEEAPATEAVVTPATKTKQLTKLEQRVVKKVKKKMNKVAPDGDNQVLAVILAIIIPFVGVAVWQNGITKDFWITLLLTLLFYLPGLIYALYKILG